MNRDNTLPIWEKLQEDIFMKSKEQIQILDDFFILHIKKQPKWIPNFIYKYILRKILVLDRFIK